MNSNIGICFLTIIDNDVLKPQCITCGETLVNEGQSHQHLSGI
jgi:hypothetical protein